MIRYVTSSTSMGLAAAGAILVSATFMQGAVAGGYVSEDGTLEIRGFIENATFTRRAVGLSKMRNTGQMEFSKDFGTPGIFSALRLNGTFRATYDAVYDLNDDEWGDSSGRSVSFAAPGNPGFSGAAFAPTTPVYAGTFAPGGDGAIPLSGTIKSPANPNAGLKLLGEDVHNFGHNGVVLAYPSRPCDVDPRGCIDGYLDFDEDELRFPEFNDRLDVIRELYLDGAIELANGDELGIKFGRQQVVWGRTDLFRVLDVVNPVDFSRNNIYDELEDIRIPMFMLNMEYRMGVTGGFDDLNFQALVKLEEPRPHNLGQGGTPNSILGAGPFFRAMSNCWHNGCTAWNFPVAGVAVDFPKHAIGIRRANVPDDLFQEGGFRIEGLYKGVGFSLNYLTFRSQLPSLRGGIPSDDPFTGAVESVFHPYALAFDIDFPRIHLFGGSADLYFESIKSAVRLEMAYTTGEEFANTAEERLFSESDVIRWVVGVDRPTFIPFLNRSRAFLISAQMFGQHILDHDRRNINSAGAATTSPIGIPDHEHSFIGTLLIQGNYMNDRLTPQVITAWDFKASSGAVAPSVSWRPTNNWVITAGANIKFGAGPDRFDDNRGAVPYPGHPAPATFSSTGLFGHEPLGRFRAGPIGQAINEDEAQLTVRYQF